MPIVTIETLSDLPGSPDDALPIPEVLQQLTNELGRLFGSEPGGTWVRARQQQRAYYAENGTVVGADVRPVLVEVLKADPGDEEALAAEARAVCQLVATALARPVENVHLIYQPAGRGRVAFGGILVR